MSRVLPNLSSEKIQRYGIPSIVEYMPHLFDDRPLSEKHTIAIIDQGVDMSGVKYDMWENPEEIDGITGVDDDGNGFIDDKHGYNFGKKNSDLSNAGSHGKMVVAKAVQTAPKLMKIMNVDVSDVGGASHFSCIDGLYYSADNGALAANLSFEQTSTVFVEPTIKHLNKNNCFWLGHTRGIISRFAWNPVTAWNEQTKQREKTGEYLDGEIHHPNLLITAGINLDYSTTTPYHEKEAYYMVYEPNASSASPVVSGLICMLKTIDDSLSIDDIRNLINDGCTMVPEIEGKCRYGILNFKNSIEKLIGKSLSGETVPVEDPDPPIEDPEPDPKYMLLSKDYIQEIETNFSLIGSPNKSPSNENIDELFDENLENKFLSFDNGVAEFEYSLKSVGDVNITKGYIAGSNDTHKYPEREAVEMEISNGVKKVITQLPTSLDHGELSGFVIPEISGSRFFVKIKNHHGRESSHKIVQFSSLVFPEMNDERFSDIVSGSEVVDYNQNNLTPVILTNSASIGEVNSNYHSKIDVEGGNDPILFELKNNPTWMSIDSNGFISGTPIEQGEFSFTVVVTDKDGDSSSKEYTININEENTLPKIQTTSIDNVFVEDNIETLIEVKDGNLPLTFKMENNPSWLSIDESSGTISGQPSLQDAGAYNFTVIVEDADGDMDSVDYTMEVKEHPPKITSVIYVRDDGSVEVVNPQ